MTIIPQTLTIEGIHVDITDEPRIRDTDLGVKLGFDRPRKVRELIDRWSPEIGPIHVRPTVGRYEIRPGIEHSQPVDERWLTEEQALFVAAKSETPAATQVLREVIRVFVLARRGMLPATAPQTRPAAVRNRLLHAADPLTIALDGPRELQTAETLLLCIHVALGRIRDLSGAPKASRAAPVLLLPPRSADAIERVDAWLKAEVEKHVGETKEAPCSCRACHGVSSEDVARGAGLDLSPSVRRRTLLLAADRLAKLGWSKLAERRRENGRVRLYVRWM